jgi:sortase (surface protein transpeptidase)
MKKWLLKLVIVIQLFSMGVELVDTLFSANNQSIELTEKQTEKQTEKETEKFEDDCKDKILFSSVSVKDISFSHTHQYLEYSTILPRAYLGRTEIPPKSIA